MSDNTKVALVTGAGTGIGRATALALSRENYAVVLAGRRIELLEETASLASDWDGHMLTVPSDVSDPRSVSELFNNINSAFQRLDLLFNNAGLSTPAVPLEDLSIEKWRQVLEVNLTGSFLCTQEAFRIMKTQQPRGGRIINNGSVSSQVPRPHSAAYTTAKHGMTGLTRSTALDGRKYRIACGQIDIGNADTDMTEKMKKGILQADNSISPEPTMSVNNVARAVVQMAALPLDANILFMTIMATNMPLVGRG
jgi:NAD(P)-dependent dehydrogenase (short-subunit alcohol dehydrogenase family)